MKKLLSVLFIAFAICANAQDFEITKSDIFKDKKKHSYLSFSLENKDGGIVTIRAYQAGIPRILRGYYIQYFDSELNEVKTLDYKVKNSKIKNAFIKDNKLHLIEIESLKKEKKVNVNVSSANLSDLQFNTRTLLGFSEDNIKQYFGLILFPFYIHNGWRQVDGNHMGDVVLSRNNNYFAINFDFKNKDTETHKVFVFNNNFEKIYEKLIEKPIKDRLFSYNSFNVNDEDGTIYFLGKSYENGSRKTKKKGANNYHFELTKVNAETQETVSFKNDKYIRALHLLTKNDKLACVGLYGENKESKINGVCVYDLDLENLSINYEKFNPFSNQFLTDKYGNRKRKKKRKKDKGIENISFNGVYLMDNNDIVVNTEEFYITTHTVSNGNGGFTTYTVYHYNDIMSFRLGADGNLKWSRNINKAQTGFKTSSYTSLPVDDATYFFINCSDKIKTLDNGNLVFSQTSSKKSNLYVISVDENGNYNTKKLIDDKDSKVYYKVKSGVASPKDHSIFLLGERKKKGRIVKIKV
jgi:hypothetical protein